MKSTEAKDSVQRASSSGPKTTNGSSESQTKKRKRKSSSQIDIEDLEYFLEDRSPANGDKRPKPNALLTDQKPALVHVGKNGKQVEEETKGPQTIVIDESEEEEEEDDEEWFQGMSPRFLKQMIDATPRQSDMAANKHNFEDQSFVNSLFKVEFYQRTPNYPSAVLELKLSPPLD